MTTSPATHYLSEIRSGEPIPEAKLAYLEQRVLNNFYAFVIARFLDQKDKSNLTQAKLARRINRGTDVVNRWLASPGNWQIGTVARLLVGIAGEEAVLSSSSLLNRPPRNQTVLDLLDDAIPAPAGPAIETSGDAQVVYLRPPLLGSVNG